MLFCTISLDAARSAGDACRGVEGESIVDGQGKIAVAAGRDKSRLVGVCHTSMITGARSKRRYYPQPAAMDFLSKGSCFR